MSKIKGCWGSEWDAPPAGKFLVVDYESVDQVEYPLGTFDSLDKARQMADGHSYHLPTQMHVGIVYDSDGQKVYTGQRRSEA